MSTRMGLQQPPADAQRALREAEDQLVDEACSHKLRGHVADDHPTSR
jgi:hypothetical protein